MGSTSGVGVMLALSSPLILPLTNLAAALGGFVLLAIWGNSLSRLLANWPSRVAGTAVTLLALSMLFDSTDGVGGGSRSARFRSTRQRLSFRPHYCRSRRSSTESE